MRRWWSWSIASSSAWAPRPAPPCARMSMAAGRAFWSISGRPPKQRAPRKSCHARRSLEYGPRFRGDDDHQASHNKEHLMSIEIYAFPPSPRAFKAMAVANYLGLDWTLRMLDLPNGKHKTPEYEALNPNLRMPTLKDGDYVLWESN